MAAPVAVSMLAQIAYQLINLYFVTRIGAEVTAGVNAAGNIVFIVSAMVQVISAGTAVLISHRVGGRDFTDANLLFNQSIALSIACAAVISAMVVILTPPYMDAVSSNVAVTDAGVSYIVWVTPGYALLFPMMALSATLRGAGVVQPTMLIFTLTVLLNAAFAPIFIAGWGTGAALGAKGAGLATTASLVIGLACMGAYFCRSQHLFSLQLKLLYPRLAQCRRILAIGLPAGAEYTLVFLSAAVVYFALRDLGASAQAGFGIGSRVLQAILLPGMSVAFVAGTIAGQNFGARKTQRVREVFRTTALMGTVVMLATTILVQWQPSVFLEFFAADVDTTANAELFLQLMSWTFVAQGLVYTCAYMFQGLGNTVPSLTSATARFVVFAAPAAWLSHRPDFRISELWYLLTVSVAIQAALSLWLLRLEFSRKLRPLELSRGPNSLLMNRAIVSGITGHLGVELARQLRAQGIQVFGLTRQDVAPDHPVQALAHLHRIEGRTQTLIDIFQQIQPEAVFHLAGLSRRNHVSEDIVPFVEANILFGTQILEAMRLSGCGQIVTAGTYLQHFDTEEYRAFNLYAATKQAFEDLLAYYVDACCVTAVRLTLCDIYSEHDRRPKLMTDIANSWASATPLHLREPRARIDLIHVADAAASIPACGRTDRIRRYSCSDTDSLFGQLRARFDLVRAGRTVRASQRQDVECSARKPRACPQSDSMARCRACRGGCRASASRTASFVFYKAAEA